MKRWRPRRLTAKQRRRRALAIRVAAHAVVAEILGLGVWRVSLKNGCVTGFVRYPPRPWWYARNALVALSGDLAGSRVDPADCMRARQDHVTARSCLRRAYGRAEVARRLSRAIAQARRLIDGHWLAIERVAARLQRTGTLDGKAVRACLAG
jgi:hypothetical protein